jgi:hypothetical protein
MKRLTLIVFTAFLLTGCSLFPFLQNDSRVQVVKLSEGVYQVSRKPESVSGYATRINSSATIGDWEPQAGCIRITTEAGGTDKALKCAASPVEVFTLGTLDVGLVRP